MPLLLTFSTPELDFIVPTSVLPLLPSVIIDVSADGTGTRKVLTPLKGRGITLSPAAIEPFKRVGGVKGVM